MDTLPNGEVYVVGTRAYGNDCGLAGIMLVGSPMRPPEAREVDDASFCIGPA